MLERWGKAIALYMPVRSFAWLLVWRHARCGKRGEGGASNNPQLDGGADSPGIVGTSRGFRRAIAVAQMMYEVAGS